MRMWMIRHSDLTFSRPIPEPLLIAKIESGEMDRRDEISASGEYWFPIQDATEVRKFLGEIRLDAIHSNPNEDTGTTWTGSQGGHTEILDGPDDLTPKPEPLPVEPIKVILKKTDAEGIPLSKGEAIYFAEKEPSPSPLGNLVFLGALLFIILGTVFLIWKGSH